MQRREVLKVLTAGVAAAGQFQGQQMHGGEHADLDLENYQPRFFSAAQYRLVSRLCDIVLPPDGRSPGAAEAGVPFYLDVTLLYSDKAVQSPWLAGLKQIDELAAGFGGLFVECAANQQEQIVASLLQHEQQPESETERFLIAFKSMTIEGYCLSDRGMREGLGYRGNAVLVDFPGCTHPEHKA